MIRVSLDASNDGSVKLSASGHSGLAESGSDILCAAVSALVQTAYLAVKDIGAEVKMFRDEKNARFEFTVLKDDAHAHDVDVIIRAALIGLKDLSSGYPHNIKLEV